MSNSPVTRQRIVFRQLSLATAFVFAEAALSSLTDVKLGPFQLAEIMGMVMLPFAFWDISRWREQRAGRLVGWHPWLFALCVAVMVVGAVAAYHREAFVIPVDATSFAKQPGWISFSRLVQFLLAFTTAYAMVRCDWSSDVCSSDLEAKAWSARARLPPDAGSNRMPFSPSCTISGMPPRVAPMTGRPWISDSNTTLGSVSFHSEGVTQTSMPR